MKKHNIHLDTYSTKSSRHTHSTFGYAPSSPFHECLIDSGASYHMAKDKAMFSALNDSNIKNVFVSDDRYLSVVGSRKIHLDNGQFKDVLCVPTLSYNLLSVYQIPHLDEGKTIEFTPHQIVIMDLIDPIHILATRIIDNITRLYKFKKFGSFSLPLVFISHSDEVGRIWHERFDHLNYHSLQTICKKMVIGLPMVSCRDGVCSKCVLKKHRQDRLEKCASCHASTPL
jgi:hypothetical protein